MIQRMLADWTPVPLPFLNTAWTSGSSWFTFCWNLTWRILSIPLLACEVSAVYAVVWWFFGIAFLWDWNENWPFPVLWTRKLLSFPNCWHIACSTLTASSFRTWTSSAGISLANDFIRFHNIDQTAVEWNCDIVLHFCSLRFMYFQIFQILKCVWVYLLSKVILYNLYNSGRTTVILSNVYLI